MKTFIRVGAWYKAEVQHLQDDLDITSLMEDSEKLFVKENIIHKVKEETAPEKNIPIAFDYKHEIAALNRRIDELTKLIQDKPVDVNDVIEPKNEESKVEKSKTKANAKK